MLHAPAVKHIFTFLVSFIVSVHVFNFVTLKDKVHLVDVIWINLSTIVNYDISSKLFSLKMFKFLMKKVLKRGAGCRAIPLKRFSLFTFWGLSLYTAILGQFIRSIDIYGLELDQRQKDIEEHELQLKKEETTTAKQENQEIDSPFLDELPDIDQTSPATILPQLLSQEAHVAVENEEETKSNRAILESKLEKLLQENKTLRQLILHLQGNISYYN